MTRLITGSYTPDLLLEFMQEDLDAGFLLIDPTGDLAPRAADLIPQKYIQRTFYFDATDTAHPAAFNVLAGAQDHSALCHLTVRRYFTQCECSRKWHPTCP
jgi:hypothetical protein